MLDVTSFEDDEVIALHARAGVSSAFFIRDLNIASGPLEGVTFDGSIVRISEAISADLAIGNSQCILVTYRVVGHFGYEIPKTAIFNLSMTRDGPVVFSHIAREPDINDGTACFDLLSNLDA